MSTAGQRKPRRTDNDITSSYEAIAAGRGGPGIKHGVIPRCTPPNLSLKLASETAVGSTDFPRRRFVATRPNATAGHDEPDIARGGPDERREAARTTRDIEDDEIGALPYPDQGRGVGVRETTSAQCHLHDVAG